MFSLDHAIADWRGGMGKAGIKDAATLDELESHLCDHMGALLQSGLDERQAFETAVEHIGRAEGLQHEFAKVQSKLFNRLTLGVVGLYCLVAGGSALLRLGSFADVSSAQQFSALAAVVLAALLMFGGPLFAKVVPVISNQRLRLAIYCMGILCVFVWLALFYRYVMTRVEWDVSQLLVGILWAWISMAALCGMIFGMEEAAANRTKKIHV